MVLLARRRFELAWRYLVRGQGGCAAQSARVAVAAALARGLVKSFPCLHTEVQLSHAVREVRRRRFGAVWFGDCGLGTAGKHVSVGYVRMQAGAMQGWTGQKRRLGAFM